MLHTILSNLVREGHTPSLATAISRNGKLTYAAQFPETGEPPIFDTASLTKPLLTYPLVVKTIGNLAQPAAGILPDCLPVITIRDLVAHTAGLVPWLPCYLYDAPYLDTIRNIGQGGVQGHVYTCLGYLVLARLLERQTGGTFRELARDFLQKIPGCEIQPGPRTDIMPTETGNRYELEQAGQFVANPDPAKFRLGQPIHGDVHDLNAFHDGGISGNAGLFATAAGCVELAHRLVHLPEWQLPLMKGDGYFYHLGFTGTGIALSPDGATVVVILTNRVCPEVRNIDFSAIRHRIFKTAFTESA